MKPRKIRLSIESVYDNVPLVSTAVNRLCAFISFSDRDSYGTELCVTEAVVNSIKHAYGDRPDYEVVVTFRIDYTKLVIEVCDRGTPMDPQLLEERKPLAMEFDPEIIETIPESGRGLPIIQGFMDAVEYRVSENRNCLKMTKFLETA
jgi:serine/threonine-protein kinase RsbW